MLVQKVVRTLQIMRVVRCFSQINMGVVMIYRLILILLVSGTMIAGSVNAKKNEAHVHGVATLQVVQDKNTLSFDLDSPLENFLGFEHAPRTEKQKQMVTQMIEKLRRPEFIFTLTDKAQCTAGEVKFKSSVLELGVEEKKVKTKNNDHAGIEIAMIFHCRVPTALKEIEVKLFDVFPGMHRLNVQLLGPRGQSFVKLTSRQPRISW